LALAALATLAQASLYPDCLSDDAFISFRYARNLTEGHGLVFNAGEPPVEGYTNFLWTLLLAGVMAGGLDPEPACRWMGLAFALAAQLCTFQAARGLLPGRPVMWALPAWLLALNSFFVIEAVQGLETVMFAALIVAALARLEADLPTAAEVSRSAGHLPLSGLWLGLAALTRPEGMILFAVVATLRATELFIVRCRPGRADGVWAALFAAPVGAHLILRRLYYQDWLPNTFHAKTGGGLEQLQRGLHYVAAGWTDLAPWIVLAIVFVGIQRWPLDPDRRRGTAALTAVWLASSAGVAAVGGDFKPTCRFLVWTFPLLAVLATSGLAAAGEIAARRGWREVRFVVAVLAAAVLIWTVSGTSRARRFAQVRRGDLAILRQAAGWFSRHLPPDAIIATGPVGAIPYYTGFTTVDMWGINDREIGRRSMPEMGRGPAGHEKGDGAAVLQRRPDVILFTEARFTPAPLPEGGVRLGYLYVSERELLERPEFHHAYRWRSVRLPATTMNFYQRIDEDTGT
jgi:hypothetical protein